MSVYQIKNIFGEYKNILPISPDAQRTLVDNYGSPLQESWNTISFKWDFEDGSESRDAFLYLGSILITSEKLKTSLQGVLKNNRVEYLPITIEGEVFFVINVCDTLDCVLNIRQSKIEYVKDRHIKWINEFVFDPIPDCPNLFHISEISTPIFASDCFIKAYEETGCIGLKFIECRQSRQGFLKSMLKK